MEEKPARYDGRIRLIPWVQDDRDITIGNLLSVFGQLPKGAVLLNTILLDGFPYAVCRSEAFPLLPPETPVEDLMLPSVNCLRRYQL